MQFKATIPGWGRAVTVSQLLIMEQIDFSCKVIAHRGEASLYEFTVDEDHQHNLEGAIAQALDVMPILQGEFAW